MPKFNVYVLATASKFIGVFEAKDAQEAAEKGMNSEECHIDSLCHQCSESVDIGDIYDCEAYEVEEGEDKKS